MQEVFATIRKVATTDASVLIVGESGTGKEMVAQAMHRQSQRRARPFVPINCGAIPEHLLESELFGHEKGAFTGAHMQRKGRLEMAHGGTLFLDEISELSPPLQVKLLRVLQEQQLERVGGREAIAINARVLAATNTNLEQAIAEGRFREDLYYRLGVVVLTLPPLRERAEDIPLLAEVFLRRYSAESKQKISGFSQLAVNLMQTHSWPGNVRELDNRIKRAVIMAQGPHLTPSDLGFPAKDTPYLGQTLKEARQAIEKSLIIQTLAKHNGQVTRTAAALGISRSTMHELIARYRIKR
jgi:two-component system NtrC family response regulator